MTQSELHDSNGRASLDQTLGALRPKLHRYCARIVGSAIDGEDIVQDVLVKAIEAHPKTEVSSIESWLFRIAHNTAIDFLRHRKRWQALHSEEDPDSFPDAAAFDADRFIAAADLQAFMRVPVAQRACTILKDVLGYSLQEIADITAMSVSAVKSSLHRARDTMRELADAPGVSLPELSHEELSRLTTYAQHFNRRDFDAIRDMLADDVRLELVAKTRMNGRREVSRYFHNYNGVHDWRLAPGLVENRPALLVFDPNAGGTAPAYFVLLQWDEGRIKSIRDFRNAKYVVESAGMVESPPIRGM